MVIMDPRTGKIVEVNIAACRYYGYTRNEMLTMNIKDIAISTGDDMISRVHFDYLFKNSQEAIAIVNRDFKITDINKKFEDLFQFSLGETKRKDLTQIICEHTSQNTSHRFRRHIMEGKFIKEEVRRRKKDGSMVDVLLLGFPMIIKGEVVGAYCMYSDISEIKAKDERMEWLATKDALTELYNRRHFLDSLDHRVWEANSKGAKQKFGILILNINEFREINEALGYIAGDGILKEFGQRLKDSIYTGDMVARCEKDQFAILVPEMEDLRELRARINIILDNLSAPFIIDNNEIQVTASIGISIYPDDGREAATLIRKADIAMQRSR
ncbi:MAG: diguanylate cyclase, partial [Tissierellia bacterium]|nr:diguanylate cyclase [Tissierellia bacterium]